MVMIRSRLRRYQNLYFFASKHIYTDIEEDSDADYIRVCDQSAIKLLTSTMKIMTIVIVSMIMHMMFPTFAYFKYNDIQWPMPVILPFTDPDSVNGLAINLVNQLFIGFTSSIGNIGIEISTCILNNTVWAIIVAIGHSIDELSGSTENPQSSTASNRIHLFRNILIQVQDYDR